MHAELLPITAAATTTLARLCRLLVMYMVGTVARFKYYFAWAISEAGLIFSGFCFNGYSAQGEARWDRYSNTHITKVEICTSAAEFPAHWNTCTGTFLRQCASPPLLSPGHAFQPEQPHACCHQACAVTAKLEADRGQALCKACTISSVQHAAPMCAAGGQQNRTGLQLWPDGVCCVQMCMCG